jgi:hypothetical protein
VLIVSLVDESMESAKALLVAMEGHRLWLGEK